MEISRCKYLLLLVLAVSCLKPDVDESCPVRTDGQTGLVSKAGVTVQGSVLPSNLAVWIAGSMDTTFFFGSGHSLVAEYQSPGVATVFMAGNIWSGCSAMNNSRPRADTLVADLSRMADTSFLCTAIQSLMLMAGNTEIESELIRTVAKISLGTVRNRISEGAYSGCDITVNKVFLINGVGRFLAFDPDSKDGRCWFAPSGEACDSFSAPSGQGFMDTPLLSLKELCVTIPYNGSANLDIVLYTGPNATGVDNFFNPIDAPNNTSVAPWAPRKTRLVLQCQIAGNTCYYPITISDIEVNKHYTVNTLSIERFGVLSPDQPYTFSTTSALVTTTPWLTASVNETI